MNSRDLTDRLVLGCFLLALALGGPAPAATTRAAPVPRAPQSLPAAGPRSEMCLNGEWSIQIHDPPARPGPSRATLPGSGAAPATHPGGPTTRIAVPGCYAGIRDSWGGAFWDVWDYPVEWQRRGATYERAFTVPRAMQGRRLRLWFGGVFHHAEYFVNDVAVGQSRDGYQPVDLDITAAVRAGENRLRVVVSARPSDLFDDYKNHWRGIWQDVYLRGVPEVRVGSDLFIVTSTSDSTIRCSTPLHNDGAAPQRVFVRHFVSDPDGRTVLRFDGGWADVPAGGTVQSDASAAWADPRLWFPHDPYLYHLHTVLLDQRGQTIDLHKTRFGFRQITWSGPHFYLNGREIFLRGHGGHSQGDMQGDVTYLRAWFRGMKRHGVNFLRLHVSPRHQALYDVADEEGMLLEAEPAFHFQVPADQAFALAHLGAMVRALRNHPSVFVWSVSNELRWRSGGEKKWLIDHAKSLDPTRPVFSSDFSGYSREGDVLGHHYNHQTVFEEWAAFGPNKPMIWDELGSVWQYERPLNNGPAGLEASAQDWTTGTWRCGAEKILNDIAGVVDGRMIEGQLHRPNALVPWDFAYVFFRWQPINKGRPMVLSWPGVEGPGVKPRLFKPFASSINPWDSTLSDMEPYPAYWVFEKHFRPARFFDDEEHSTFFSGQEVSRKSKLYYDDLRPVDEIRCRVETVDGKALTERSVARDIRPGQIVQDVQTIFTMPQVRTATPVMLVRQFFHKGVGGYRDVQKAKVFPQPGDALPAEARATRIGLAAGASPALREMLAAMGLSTVAATPPGAPTTRRAYDLLVTDTPQRPPWVDRYVGDGGRVVELLGAGAPAQGDNLLNETFSFPITIATTQPIATWRGPVPATRFGRPALGPAPTTSPATGLQWSAWTPPGQTVHIDGDWIVEQRSFLRFGPPTDQGDPYIHATLDEKRQLRGVADGTVTIDYELGAPRGTRANSHRWARVLLRDARQQWFISSSARKIMLGGGRFGTSVPVAALRWETAEGAMGGRLGGPPDFSVVTGVGLQVCGGSPYGLKITRFQVRGAAPPSARIPLHGPPHRLLAGLDQRDFTRWRGGSTSDVLAAPAAGNSRVVLHGDRDGRGGALMESFAGDGIRVSTSLRIVPTWRDEPASVQVLANAITYLTTYRPAIRRAGLVARGEARDFFRGIGVVADDLSAGVPGDLSPYACLIVDGADPSLTAAMGSGPALRAWAEGGGTVLVLGVTPQTIDGWRKTVGADLRLTDPYLGERAHCIKAPVCWTLRDSPREPAEYYDGLLVPQPYEPNLHPLLSGLSNRDLHWNGQPMFDQGIEVAGMDPVDIAGPARVLVSNWRIDWSLPPFGGEYTNAGKDLREAYWFINRDPVLLSVQAGRGQFVLCQLHLSRGGDAGRRVVRALLTNLGCAIGVPTNFAPADATFDLSPQRAQQERLARVRQLLGPIRRQYYGSPPELRDSGIAPDVTQVLER